MELGPFPGSRDTHQLFAPHKVPALHLAKVPVGLHLHHDHHATKERLPWQEARELWAEDCEPREPEEKGTSGLPICPASALLPPHSPHNSTGLATLPHCSRPGESPSQVHVVMG